MADERRVGFIGLGAMGLPMARRMLGAGLAVAGFDVVDAAVDALAAAGGRGVGSPADAAADADVVHVIVATAAQVMAVLDGPAGVLAGLRPGATVVVHSTVPPAFAREQGERLAAAGHPFLDAPVSGGQIGAVEGRLVVMASGPAAAFAVAEPGLAAVAQRVYRLGEAPGIGSTVKMINQHLAGVHLAAAGEAMALGTRAGADPATLFEIITASAGSSWMFQNRVPHMLARDFTPLSAIEIFVKDLGIVLDAGRELRFPLPLAAAAHQQFLGAAAAGHGREDDSAVVKVYERLAGIEVKGRLG
jgi:3-hydroxyisobutyrate dehydrogenase